MSARRKTLAAATTACTLLATMALTTTEASASEPPRPPTSAQCVQTIGLACYSPAQVQRAYHLAPLYAQGFTGKGRTIVIVDPFGSPTIRHDLAVFDRSLGVPAPPSFQVLQPVGRVPPFNPKDQEMVAKAGETTLDVEWSHAIAPGADLLLVETPVAETPSGGGFAALMEAENYVVAHGLGDVISQSFSLPEQNFPGPSFVRSLRFAYLDAYRHRVTVLAASNDTGATGPMPTGDFYTHPIVEWPASDPLVTGVGGTTLHLNAAGRRTSPDTAWNDTFNAAVARLFGTTPPLPWASGGGRSVLFGRPDYQNTVRTTVGTRRGVPDVAMSGSLSGGVLIYDSFMGAPGSWGPAGGTSEATPEFAGIVAIADQYAGRRLGFINPALYRLERTHGSGIVDITHGTNTVSFVQGGQQHTVVGYPAKPGYDLVTGVGTIDAARFVPALANGR